MPERLFTPGLDEHPLAFSDAALITAMGAVEADWALAQADAELISAADGRELAETIRACASALASSDGESAQLAAESVSGGNPVIPFVRRLREAAGERSALIHRGLTSQDVLDTALGLMTREAVDSIAEAGQDIVTAIADLSDEHAQTVCLARTLTQPALPTTFGLRAAQWGAKLGDIRIPEVEPAQIGGAAGTRAAVVELAGESAGALITAFCRRIDAGEAAAPWHTNRSRVAEWGLFFAQVSTAAASIAADVLLGARAEVGELRTAATGGSSAMPHKANPTQAVLLKRSGLMAPSALQQLLSASALFADERPDGAWHAEWPALAELANTALTSAELLRDLMRGLRPDAKAMRRNLDAAGTGIYSERASIARSAGRSEPQDLTDPNAYLGQAEEIRRDIVAGLRTRLDRTD